MRRSLSSLVLVLALVAPSGWLPARSLPSEGTTDPLVEDSLASLGALVDAEHCTLKDALDADPANGTTLPYVHCDDGLPPSGGGSAGIPVPVKYKARPSGNDWKGLPPPAPVEEVQEVDAIHDLQPESENRITLDVNVTLPPSPNAQRALSLDMPTVKPPRGGYPVIVFMHGCCGGNRSSWEAASVDGANEQWHHSNAWFAARGYVVVTYTARGFRNSSNQGSTGTTQLDSRRYEVNDYQYLVGLLADHDARRRAAKQPPLFRINPKKIAAVGGSYGGGFSWLAATDPTWRSPAGRIPVKLAAAVPKYGWTDLAESLVPSGHYLDRDPQTGKTWIAPTAVSEAVSRRPIGVEKQSIVAGLYATGNLHSGNHTTFPRYLHDAYARLQAGEPYDGDPQLEAIVDQFLSDRSAYYQGSFWKRVRNKGLRVPLYVPAAWTDPLFPTMESVRFYNKLKSVAPKYPIQMYLGDFQHFVANKPTEWGDLCGEDHHVCRVEDYPLSGDSINLNKAPTRVRAGINSRISRFLDHFLLGKGERPTMNVSATTTICSGNATEGYPVTEPGIEYRAPNWRALGSGSLRTNWDGGGPAMMTSSAANDLHASESDPVFRDRQADKCFSPQELQPGPGVVQLIGEPLAEAETMMGIPQIRAELTTSATDYWISARLLDLPPQGRATLVARGVCKVNLAAHPDVGCETFDMFGNGWRFEAGHRVVLELSQADTPFLRRSNFPSTIQFESVELDIPTVPEARRRDFRD